MMEDVSDRKWRDSSFPCWMVWLQHSDCGALWLVQVVECRRVLKWTYAYGFYLPNEDQAKRHFFEYLQGTSITATPGPGKVPPSLLACPCQGGVDRYPSRCWPAPGKGGLVPLSLLACSWEGRVSLCWQGKLTRPWRICTVWRRKSSPSMWRRARGRGPSLTCPSTSSRAGSQGSPGQCHTSGRVHGTCCNGGPARQGSSCEWARLGSGLTVHLLGPFGIWTHGASGLAVHLTGDASPSLGCVVSYSVTHTYFENLVRALENGLCDVEQPGKASLQKAAPPALQQQGQGQSGGKRDKKGQAGSSSQPVSSSSTAPAGGPTSAARGSTAFPARGSTSMAVARLAKAAVRGRSGGQAATAASAAPGAGASSSSAPGGAGPGGTALGIASSAPAARGGSATALGMGARSHHGDEPTQHAGGTAPHRQLDYWQCAHCSFANRQSTTVCSMCNLPRGHPSR